MATLRWGTDPAAGRIVPAVAGGRLDWELRGKRTMEKVVLLCVLIAIIGILAELSPAPEPQRKA